ncbi:hypothetical protein [Bacillus sp. Hm123]|uniref:hypothetical protein n=1 Tax=Bacillus sp. Hm123 TaxID=3450745 RepID=UPI003F426798
MAQIKEAAYEDLRNYIQSNWKYIELQDETGSSIIRLDSTDNRVTSTIEGNNVKITIVIKGSELSLPKTFAKSVIFKESTGGIPLSEESFTAFTIEAPEDELTVNHTIQVPQL